MPETYLSSPKGHAYFKPHQIVYIKHVHLFVYQSYQNTDKVIFKKELTNPEQT